MTVAIVDYGSGNLRSAAKAFERAAREAGTYERVLVTANPRDVADADRIVLPGVGAFAQQGGLTLHVWNHYGENNHHIVESCFKGLARSLRVACEIDPRQTTAVPSTKGVL